jgi:pantoate--beta-alanine ligase
MKAIAIRDPGEWKAYCASLAGTKGFVPTMGALHEGHATLASRAAAECDVALASVFVNPTQFNDPKDLAAYPRAEDADLEMLGACGVRAVFMPTFETIYPDGYRYKVEEKELSTRLCGAFRPGHFDGVLTVVMKLLLLTRADRAYFGEKDYQQMMLVRGMAKAFFLDTEIVPCPIVREANGLAMSSRNERLSPEDRARAGAFFLELSAGGSADEAAGRLKARGFEVEYVEDVEDPETGSVRRLGAIRLGGVRLIDNVPVRGAEGV